MDAISMLNVNKYYGQHHVLRNINLSIPIGECVCIVGPNGAGKTTLVRLLLGLLRPFSGEIRVLGYKPFDRAPGFFNITAFLLDENTYWENLTVEEHFHLLGNFYRSFRGDSWLIPIMMWNLEKQKDKRICTLSRGLLKRVGLASAFHRNFRVLILDEPYNDLDLATQKVLREKLNEVKLSGHTIISTFQDPWQAMDIIDRLVILCEGTIIANELTASPKIAGLNEIQLKDYILETIEKKGISG